MFELIDLSFAYLDSPPLFQQLCLQLHDRENVLLKGNNGSGKSTFLKLLMGILPASGGHISLCGKQVTRLQAAMFAKVFYQSQNTTDNLLGISQMQDWHLWQTALPALPDYPYSGDRLFTERSTGEQKQDSQRILPYIRDKYWVLDEPFASLDAKASDALLQLLLSKMEHQPGMLVVAHEPAGLESYFGRVLSICNAQVQELKR